MYRLTIALLKKKTKNIGIFVVRVLVALAGAIIDQDSREMREQSICRQVGSAYSQPSLAAQLASISVAFPLDSTSKVFCTGKLKLWCIRKVKIRCVKLFSCILIWKDEFNCKVCELVKLDCRTFAFSWTKFWSRLSDRTLSQRELQKNRIFCGMTPCMWVHVHISEDFTISEPCIVTHIREKEQQDARFFLIIHFV